MAQGILGGIALGAVFSVGVAGVVSVLVPIQPQPAPQVGSIAPVAGAPSAAPQAGVVVRDEAGASVAQPELALRAPSGEELPKEPVAAARPPQTTTDLDGTAANNALPAQPVTPPENEQTASLAAPSTLAPLEGAYSDTKPDVPAALPQPQTGQAADLPQPRPLPEGVSARAGGDEPVLPNPQALAPMIPDDSQDVEIAAQTPPRMVPDAGPETEPATGEETFIVVEPAPSTQNEPAQAETVPAPRPRVTSSPGTQVGTLGSVGPSVGTPARTLVTRGGDAAAGSGETVTQAAADGEDTRPIRVFGQPFENPEGKPLMGIVLMDTGVDLDAAAIGLPALSSFPYPVSFAVDANLVDAAERVARYRAEGFDVLAIVDLPSGAQPTDAEVSLSVALNGLPEIVGVLEGTGEGLQSSREVADQVTRILQASGHGLVAQSKGLNSMPKLALKEGVPAAAVFRDFDSEGQQPRVIRRFLDQAAFKAAQEGGVIMLGRLRPETIEALLVWGLADRAGSVALAPVSAVLLGQR